MCIFHKWSMWSQIEKGTIKRKYDYHPPVTVGNYIVQERVCLKCGKKQLDTENTYI